MNASAYVFYAAYVVSGVSRLAARSPCRCRTAVPHRVGAVQHGYGGDLGRARGGGQVSDRNDHTNKP